MFDAMIIGSVTMMPGMMLVMGLLSLLVPLILIPAVAVLVKYLLFSKPAIGNKVSSDD